VQEHLFDSGSREELEIDRADDEDPDADSDAATVELVEPQSEPKSEPQAATPEPDDAHVASSGDDAELLDRAVEVLMTARRPTQVVLQRQLDLTAKEAREILARLEDMGVLQAPTGRGPWEPLIDLAEWKARR
jgi:hypothetical protein